MANILSIRVWIQFLTDHLGIKLSKTRVRILNIVLVVAVLCLVINLFYPIVFSVTNNVYRRESFYGMYEALACLYLIDSVLIYYKARRKGGLFNLFPVYIFIIPAIIGVIIQSMFYGVSAAWTGVAIAIAGVMTSMKNEIIFTDGMTGLYNRMYLEQIEKEFAKKKVVYATGIMIDLNDFKSINDNFGHASGDEFVIMINSIEESLVERICDDLKSSFDEFNKSGDKPYVLSIALGHAVVDLEKQTMNEFLSVIDPKMYEDKKKYYEKAKESKYGIQKRE